MLFPVRAGVAVTPVPSKPAPATAPWMVRLVAAGGIVAETFGHRPGTLTMSPGPTVAIPVEKFAQVGLSTLAEALPGAKIAPSTTRAVIGPSLRSTDEP